MTDYILPQFGLLDLGFGSDDTGRDDDDDEDLEAELSALTRGVLPSRDKKRNLLYSVILPNSVLTSC